MRVSFTRKYKGTGFKRRRGRRVASRVVVSNMRGSTVYPHHEPKPWCSCWCQCVVTQPKPWCSCWCQCVVTQPKPWCSCWYQCVIMQPKPRWKLLLERVLYKSKLLLLHIIITIVTGIWLVGQKRAPVEPQDWPLFACVSGSHGLGTGACFLS